MSVKREFYSRSTNLALYGFNRNSLIRTPNIISKFVIYIGLFKTSAKPFSFNKNVIQTNEDKW